MNTNKINWKNAIIGGVIGTIAFDIIGFFFTGTWWDIHGVFGHFSNGILLAILYAGIAPSLWGPTWLRTLLFVTAETVALVWFFMFPLLGAGIAGTKMAAIIPLVSMVRHIAYGVPVWYFVHKLQNKENLRCTVK
jgi:hypothetical protein